ncbi:Na+/H+ antiporter NhaC [Halanaerobacter jeridensis]|uniref:NhaC family Na+:H+ antiporter n=1 Tax=Halanaerobacter jeridensis TaxID=706427 RepID=A0A939BML4_9FIRM|nr:Na+/H+ antiporter NhaC [Halanaerobacter jeridensis]MBM7556880.1 NhaC family Na+:H+ antiporter [Halanaerobacter jeridensis]
MEKSTTKRNPTIKEAIFILLTVIGVILLCLSNALVLETALVLGSMTAALFSIYLGYNWSDIEGGLLGGIQHGLGACIILIIIGMVIATWILGGTIQTMLFYGLKLLTPPIFLPVSFLLGTIVSLLIGSSFGTIATIGIVLMGVAEGLGIPAHITAGAIVSGAIFGDKMSPMSDSTNLAAAMSGTGLFEHIRSMLYVSIPTVSISLVLYGVIGKMHLANNVDFATVEKILSNLQANFNISLLTLIPPVLMIILSMLKVPAIVSLSASFVTASAFAMITQGASFAEILDIAANGYVSNTGYKMIDNLLTQGGINNMMSTVAIIMAGTAMGGILEENGVLNVLLEALMEYIETPRDLIISTLISAYIMLFATGEMMVSMIIPGRTLEPAYKRMNIKNNVLSRTLETSATLGCAVLPWGVVSVYIQNVLDVSLKYIPYTFLAFIAPVITLIYAYTGFGLFKRE